MKNLLSLMALTLFVSGCDAINALDSAANIMPATMNSMNDKMNDTNRGIAETNESVRLQKLILSKDDMLKPENTQDLSPVPLGMIPGALKFGEAATPKELIEFTFVLINEIRDQKPADEDANNPEIIKKYDHQKMIKFSELITIAGYCPEAKVDQIIHDQILEGGLYYDEAFAFLMARVFFLGTYLNEKMLATPLKTVDKMQETITRLGAIDKILKLYKVDPAFKTETKLEIVGFLKQDPIKVSLYDGDNFGDDIWNAPKLWKKVLKAFDRDLKNGNVMTTTADKKTAVKSKIDLMKKDVQGYIDSWK